MDDDTDFVELIRYTVDSFEIQEDLDKWDSIQEKVQLLRARKQEAVNSSQDNLRQLSRELARSEKKLHDIELQAKSNDAHVKLDELEKDKYSLAKAINELEESNASKLAIIENLEEQLIQLESEDDVENARDMVEDATILKLNLYRSLGVLLEGQSHSTGLPQRAVIESSKGTVEVFDLERKYSPAFIANYLWERL